MHDPISSLAVEMQAGNPSQANGDFTMPIAGTHFKALYPNSFHAAFTVVLGPQATAPWHTAVGNDAPLGGLHRQGIDAW